MEFSYKTNGVCSRTIHIEGQGGIVKKVRCDGGCNGNTKGIGSLVEGMPVDEVITRLKGIKCGFKGTSCPDQLATALEEMKKG